MADPQPHPVLRHTETLGRAAGKSDETIGYWGVLVGESLYWIFAGRRLNQPVRLSSVIRQMMKIGILAIPFVSLFSSSIGIILAIQGIYPR